VVRFHSEFAQCLPTLVCCLIGGGLAGVLAAWLKKHHPSFSRNAAGVPAESREPLCMK
jgi:hypothetical protein